MWKSLNNYQPLNYHKDSCFRYFQRSLILIISVFGFLFNIYAQAPQRMSYQAVMRNSAGQLLINRTVGLKISILQGSSGGTAVYIETQAPTTNANGLVSLQVGGGTVVSGNFSTINWGADSYYIKTEVDPAGGTAYSITSTTQLLSVPYALYSVNTASPMVYPAAGIPVSTGSAWSSSITDNSANWNTAYNNRISTFSTTGNNGPATFSSNTLNIPEYTLAGLGGIGLSALSASLPLSYNSGTGAFSIQGASGSQNGYLSSADWTTFNNKVGALGTPSGTNANGGSISSGTLTFSLADATNPGLLKSADWTTFNNKVGSVTAGSTKIAIGGTSTAPTVDVNTANLGTIGLTTGTSGTDVGVTGSPANLGGSITLNIPDAGATATTRGVVNADAQTFYGAKTFNSAISAPTTGNTINGLIINGGSLSGITGETFASGNFDQSSSSGTFKTGTGNVTLNGNTTLATGRTLTLTGLNSSLLKTDASGVVSAATAGTDYQSPITLGTTVNATNSNGVTFSSNTLTMGFATGSYPGLVSTAAQTFAGAKTFSSASSDPLLITGTGFATQVGSSSYSQLVVDNTSGAVRKAPNIVSLQDVLDNTITTPPASPSVDDSYLIPSGATGVWSTNINKIATYNGSGWTYVTPVVNNKTTVTTGTNAGKVYVFDGTSWNLSPGSGTALSDLVAAKGINTIDNTNWAQIWNWSTATTQSPLTLKASALTTSNLLTLTGGSALTSGSLLYASGTVSASTTNGLIYIKNTATSTTGKVATIQANSTAGTGLTVLANGNVGIGTATPASTLEVNGAAVNTSVATVASGYTANFSNSNIASITTGGTANPSFTLSNMKAGGAYTLVTTGAAYSGTPSFTCTGFTFIKMGTVDLTAGKANIFSFIVVGTNIYVTMAVQN